MSEFWFKRRNVVLGGATVIAFFLIWESIFEWLIPLNTFIMSKPSMVFGVRTLIVGMLVLDYSRHVNREKGKPNA